jgi:hypothetical protein
MNGKTCSAIRMSRSLFALLALAFAALAAAPGALAQTIHIEMQGDNPVFVDRPCDGEKGKVCNAKNAKENINFIVRGSGSGVTIEHIVVSGAGPNDDSNPGCYGSVVSGCGNVPAQYCTADHTPGQPWRIQVDFPNVNDQCRLECGSNTCRLDVENIANWRWNYQVWVNVNGVLKMADPIIVNRGVNGN